MRILLALLAVACTCRDTPAPPESGWRVYAVKYGQSAAFRYSSLVAGAPKDARVPLAWGFFVAQGPGRTVLIDTGVGDVDLANKWKIEGWLPSDEAIERLGVAPDEVTDVVLTHSHWDHVGNLEPWTEARFWMQRSEWEWASGRVSEERPARSGVQWDDVLALTRLKDRLELVQGDREIAPGLLLHLGGAHTPGTQWVEVRTGAEVISLAGDNAYLYENIDKNVAIGSTVDAAANLSEVERMAVVASRPDLVIPGHDPRLWERFAVVAEGVVEIR